MPVPRVADISAVRKPIRPRDGTVNCRRTQPEPWLLIESMRPLRSAMSCVTVPMYSSGTSMVVFSIGSLILPSMVLVTTCGRPTVSSKPSRRICSARMASASSPRPWTSQASGRSVGSTLIDTLPMSSRSRRSLSMRAVSLWSLPSRPASGESLVPKVIEMAGSSTWMSGSGFGSFGSTMVSPIMMSLTPATATMSPGPADSTGVRSRPCVRSSSTTRKFSMEPSTRDRP